MDFKLIMENWRKFSATNEKLNEQSAISWNQADDLVGVAAERDLKPSEIQALKTWLQSIPDDADDGTKSIIPNVLDVIKSQEADKSFKSNSFTLEDIQKDEPELAKAIKVFRGKNLSRSNLLFDGQKLHWRVGKEIIYSWGASSGHYEDDILARYDKKGDNAKKMATKILAKARVTRGPEGVVGDRAARTKAILDILKFDAADENPNFTRERLMEDIEELLNIVDKQSKVAKSYRELLGQRKDADSDPRLARKVVGDEYKDNIKKIKKQYYALDRKIRELIMTYVEFVVDAGADYQTSPEQRRAMKDVEGMGPCPEGKYVISHTMQDLTNMTSSRPFAQMLASTALMYTSDIGKTDVGLLAIKDTQSGQGDSAWGRFRVRISNIAGDDKTRNWERIPAYTGKRSGFFIHGGDFRGSSGCIDLGDNMDSFAKFWTVGGVAKAMGRNVKISMRRKGFEKYFKSGGWISGRINIPLFVKYKEIEKKKLVARDPIAKRFAKFIFDAAPSVKNLLKPADGGVATSPDVRD